MPIWIHTLPVSHSALSLVAEVKSIPGFVSFLEDSEDETETESEQSEERHCCCDLLRANTTNIKKP